MLSTVIRIAVCTSSFLYTFYVLCKFTYFLSIPVEDISNNELKQEDGLVLKALWMLIVNMSLLGLFIVQHSAMASNTVKDFYNKHKIEDIERSIYNASSAVTLHLLISQWQPITWISVWDFYSSQSNKVWFIVSAFHTIGWCMIYIGCVMMDISELAGLKQVYYKISGRPPPMTMKSRDLQRYFMHMRHPSFTAFFIILWIYPLMSIDRLLLAVFLTIYMVLMWTIDEDDYSYHSIAIARKERELQYKSH